MLQALDLARENALLRNEVNRLREEIARLARAGEVSAPRAPSGHCPAAEDTPARAPRGVDPRAPLALIVPRNTTWDYELLADRFAEVPSCAVIVDRRSVERRRRQTSPTVERRRSERRCGEDEAVALVVSVGSDR